MSICAQLPNKTSIFAPALEFALVLVGTAGYLRARTGAHAEPAADAEGPQRPPETFRVDGTHGDDGNRGTADAPLRSISAAIALLPDPLTRSVTIEVVAGSYASTGGHDMLPNTLQLMRRMRPGVTVKVVGRLAESGGRPVLAWTGNATVVDVREGDWWLENLQIGSGSTQQRRGVMVSGPAHVVLKDVTFRTRSISDAGIYAQRGGQVSLRGAIRLNEELHDKASDESFCGIIATDHGIVRFVEGQGASLDMGNGSLSASYYGCIRLGCEQVRITNWSDQSNLLAINNGGRIDLGDSTVRLCARQKRNTPIGLEHDGHILGEGAHLVIEGENEMAIALQKASTLTCNDIELRGRFEYSLWASSGSMFVGRFRTDVGRVEATTGANINIEKIGGKLVGPVVAQHCGTISLPDRNVLSQ